MSELFDEDRRQQEAAHAHDEDLMRQDRESAFERAYKDWRGIQSFLKTLNEETGNAIVSLASEQDWEQLAYWCGTLDLYRKLK